ncbi:hypothetical protein [Streptomyces sp. RPT161]|uniref:hypothetical protein n=1 Tax=Streptomyces sp. RPT161 TaxID=3015993 RepID=UPI0022B8DF33|nr:hypothetical protein [Streptomyces sp. RPT161]
MNPGGALFSNGDLAHTLNHQLGKIANAVAGVNEDDLLSSPESDTCRQIEQQFRMEPIVLERGGMIIEPIEDGFATVDQFGRSVRMRQTALTVSVPYTGDRILLTLKPSTFTFNPPRATVREGELLIHWTGPLNPDPDLVKQSLNSQLDTIQQWLDWSTVQVMGYNSAAAQQIAAEVRSRKARVLANRNLQASLGFPMRKRPDAATYAVPITRREIVPRHPTPNFEPFRPEPALDEAQYEAALEVLRNQRNALERSPSTAAKLGEEQIRDILLIGLNSQFEGRAAGEVFNGKGKTDILIREGDRHIFIGECKIWRGPKTITDTLGQLLGYLVWRDTKAALLLFIRSGVPSDIIGKAVNKIREHPNYKRDGRFATDERHDFVFCGNADPNREIQLAFLPFHLPAKTATADRAAADGPAAAAHPISVS